MLPLKIFLVTLGLVFCLLGAAAVGVGGFVFGIERSLAADGGYVTTPTQTVGSNGFALTAPDINTQVPNGWVTWALANARATVRITGTSQLPAPVFIGVAPTARLTKYLSGVTRDRVTSIDIDSESVEYEHVDGTKLPALPTKQTFWEAHVSGTGSQTLEWELREGDWAIVVMNADASPPVVVDMTLSARFGIIPVAIAGLLAGGVVILAIGVTLVVLGTRRRRSSQPEPLPVSR